MKSLQYCLYIVHFNFQNFVGIMLFLTKLLFFHSLVIPFFNLLSFDLLIFLPFKFLHNEYLLQDPVNFITQQATVDVIPFLTKALGEEQANCLCNAY